MVAASLMAFPVQAADMLSGKWRLDAAKSTYSPGPAPRSQTQNYTVAGDSIQVVIDTVTAEGKAARTEYTAMFDGKDHSMKTTLDGAPNPNAADMVAWRRIDDFNYEIVTKLKGQALGTTKRVISKDGKLRTDTVTGKNVEGRTVNNTVVYTRQ